MALQSSETISLDDIQNEFGGSNPINISDYYRGGTYVPDIAANSDIPTNGTIKLSDFYGASDQLPIVNDFSIYTISDDVLIDFTPVSGGGHWELWRSIDGGSYVDVSDYMNYPIVPDLIINNTLDSGSGQYCYKVRKIDNTTNEVTVPFSNVDCYQLTAFLNSYILSSTSSTLTVCGALGTTYWLEGPDGSTQTLTGATAIYTSSSGTTKASANYYSDGSVYRYWNGTNFTTSATSCGTGIS